MLFWKFLQEHPQFVVNKRAKVTGVNRDGIVGLAGKLDDFSPLRLALHELCHFIEIQPIERCLEYNFGFPLFSQSTNFFDADNYPNIRAAFFRELRVSALQENCELKAPKAKDRPTEKRTWLREVLEDQPYTPALFEKYGNVSYDDLEKIVTKKYYDYKKIYTNKFFWTELERREKFLKKESTLKFLRAT